MQHLNWHYHWLTCCCWEQQGPNIYVCVCICFKQKKTLPLSVCPLVLLFFSVASPFPPLHRSVCISIPTSPFTFSASHFAPGSPSRLQLYKLLSRAACCQTPAQGEQSSNCIQGPLRYFRPTFLLLAGAGWIPARRRRELKGTL